MRWRFVAAAGGVVLWIGLGGGAQAAPSRNLPKGKGSTAMAERSLDYAGKALPGKSSEIQSLRAQLQSLAQKGESFSAKAGPLEQECGAIDRELQQFKALKEKRDAERKQLLAQIKEMDASYERSFKPRWQAIQQEAASMQSQGCWLGRKLEKQHYERCRAMEVPFVARRDALTQEEERWKGQRGQLVSRLKASDAEFEKIRLPLKARFDKYQEGLKAYKAERAAWDGEVRQLWAKANSLMAEANRQRAAENARREAVQKLKGQVAGIQEALRRLSKSMLSDASQRAEWEKATQEAMKNAWDRGKGMAVDEGLGVLGKRLENQLESANQQIQRAVTQLSGEKDPARRERLHAAIKLMGQQRDEIRQAKSLVVDRLGDAKKMIDGVDYATSDPGDLEKSLKGAFTIVTTTLGDPKVQQALKIGGSYAAGAGYAQSIVESSYDITAEVISWRRINQLNRNSDEYLKAVDRLKGNMERTVQKIQALEKEGK